MRAAGADERWTIKCKWCHPHYWPLFAVDPQNVYNHTDHVTDCGEQCLLDLLSPGPGGCIARDCGRPDGPHHEAHSSRANSTLCGSSAADNRGKMHGALAVWHGILVFWCRKGLFPTGCPGFQSAGGLAPTTCGIAESSHLHKAWSRPVRSCFVWYNSMQDVLQQQLVVIPIYWTLV